MPRNTNYEPADVNAALYRIRTRPTVTLKDASLALGTHLQTLIKAAKRDALEFPAMQVGSRWVVPTPPLLAVLHLEPLPSAITGELIPA